MRRSTHLKYMTVAFLPLMSLMPASSAFGYPPNNAAVLYYKAALMYHVEPEMNPVMADLRKGKIELDDRIRDVVKTNRHAIIAVLDACKVKDCDWGMDYSKGFELVAANYAELLDLSELVGAEAKIYARDGHWKTALSRCLSLHKMASHVNDRLFVSHLVGIVIDTMAHDCTTEILSGTPPETETLAWLKTQLTQIEGLPLAIGPALDGERQSGVICITLDQMSAVSEFGFGDDALQETILAKVRAGDAKFFETNRAAWIQYWDEAIAAFALPYPQAYAQLSLLRERLESNPDANLTAQMVPACRKVCSQWTKSKTHYNAMQIAIDLYIARSETGRLPDALPADAPNDPFSGRPFRYEKTADGFTLRCRGKDLDRDEAYEFEYRVMK